jgi:hypothetical protein
MTYDQAVAALTGTKKAWRPTGVGKWVKSSFITKNAKGQLVSDKGDPWTPDNVDKTASDWTTGDQKAEQKAEKSEHFWSSGKDHKDQK